MYFVLAVFTIIGANINLGYPIQTCASSHSIDAYYALSRSLPLFLLAIFSLVIHSTIFLVTISTAMILVQFLDAIVGYKSEDVFKTYGPLAISVVNLILLIVSLFQLTYTTNLNRTNIELSKEYLMQLSINLIKTSTLMPQSYCICVVALSTINDYFLHQSKNRTDINEYEAYLSIRFSYKTKKATAM